MYLKSLYLHNFRLYREAFFEFSPDINLICGQNAIGKTSLLEAIYFLTSGGASFRTNQISHLIHHGASYFYLEAQFVKHGIEQRLKITYGSKERKIVLNNTVYPSVSGLCGLLLGIAFSPEDITLINGPPQGRRHFLDAQLSQADPLYSHHLSRYHRAMRQRNYLLKAKTIHSIESWEYEMALSASYISQKRFQLANQLETKAQALHQVMTGESSALKIVYDASCKAEQEPQKLRQYYLEQYRKNRVREMVFAATLCGPHKDDLTISMEGKEVRYFASEGQQRSVAAILRFAGWERLHQMTEEKPLMLIDDLGASLDEERCKRIIFRLEALSQVFITSTRELRIDLAKEKKLIVPQASSF